jgi:hypothetical protein
VSTFLVSFGVVAATIAAVVHVVLNGPDQPPTIRRDTSRAKPEPRRRRRHAAPAPLPAPVAAIPSPSLQALVAPTPALALPDSDIMRLRVQPSSSTTLWERIRSGVALIVLVAILGALLAMAVGGIGLGLALLLRSATS